ncbi:hypothetical protein TRVA0_036S01134 [Trichomonascus vanleenenianus]|uniref:ATP-dependent DNA helicase YKU80 n=1 Tax=Trichomonascus vanleenenianus TaxID=2268995 RepID=UPI003ECA0BB8
MGLRHGSRAVNDFQWGMNYIYTALAEKVMMARKTVYVGVLGARAGPSMYKGRKVYWREYMGIGQVFSKHVRAVRAEMTPSQSEDGDVFEAVIHAAELVKEFCGTKKFLKRIILVTNGSGELSVSESDLAIKNLQDAGIRLTILGIDLENKEYETVDWESYGEQIGLSAAEVKQRRLSSEFFQNLAMSSPIVSYTTYEEADISIRYPHPVQPKSAKLFSCLLTIGDPRHAVSASTFEAKVVGYAASRTPKRLAATKFYKVRGALRELKSEREYLIKDEEKDPKDYDVVEAVSRDPGYMYGQDIQPIQEYEEQIMRPPEREVGIEIIGFLDKLSFKRFMAMGYCDYVVAENGDNLSQLKLSALVQSLINTDRYAFGRAVVSQKTQALRMVLLSPYRNGDGYDALVMCDLPFAEDFRDYRFPSLLEPKTISGKPLPPESTDGKRKIPTEETKADMHRVVNSLLNFDPIDDNNECIPNEAWDETNIELLNTYQDLPDPITHRIRQVLKERMVLHDAEIPPVDPQLIQWNYPVDELFKLAKPHIASLKQKLSMVEREPRKAVRRANPNARLGEAEVDLESLLAKGEEAQAPEEGAVGGPGLGLQAALDVAMVGVAGSNEDKPLAFDEALPPEFVPPEEISATNTLTDFRNLMKYLRLTEAKPELMKSMADDERIAKEPRQIVEEMIELTKSQVVERDLTPDEAFEYVETIKDESEKSGIAWSEIKPMVESILEVAPKKLKRLLNELLDSEYAN